MSKVYSVRAVPEVCKLQGGAGTHRRAGIDFGIEARLLASEKDHGVLQVSEDDLATILKDDLLIIKAVDAAALKPATEPPEPDREELARLYKERFGKAPHAKMPIEKLIERLEHSESS